MEELAQAADEAVAELRERRRTLARGPARLAERFERAVDTDDVEYMDREEVTPERKVRLIRELHGLNRRLFQYHRFMHVVRPLVQRIADRAGRPARLLELASGAGEFSLELARLATERGLPVEVTGSDIVPAYVERANAQAAHRALPARFRVLNAFDLDLQPGEVDLVFIAQSMHHFQPGQLAMMIAQSQRAGARHFVGVDGRRSLFLLGFLPVVGLATGDPKFMHDAFVSARRFYADAELSLIAKIAAPEARVRAKAQHPSISVLQVDF